VSALDVFGNEARAWLLPGLSAPAPAASGCGRFQVSEESAYIYICIYVCDMIVRVFRCVGGEICSHGGEVQVQVQGVGLIKKGVGTCQVADE